MAPKTSIYIHHEFLSRPVLLQSSKTGASASVSLARTGNTYILTSARAGVCRGLTQLLAHNALQLALQLAVFGWDSPATTWSIPLNSAMQKRQQQHEDARDFVRPAN
jgi:hypothetical protein